MAFQMIKSALDGNGHNHHNSGVILTKYEPKLNSGSWDEPIPAPVHLSSNNNSNTTTTTAQLHSATALLHTDPLKNSRTAYNGLHPLIIPNASTIASVNTLQHQHHHHHHHQHSKSCGSPSSAGIGKVHEAEHTATIAVTGSTIAGGSFSTNGGSAAVGGVITTTSATTNSATKKRLEHNNSTRTLHSENSWCSDQSEQDLSSTFNSTATTATVANTSDEEAAVTEDERNVTSLSAPNQRNSQLRSTFNRAKQHLSFDKWRSSSSNAGNAANNNSANYTANSLNGVADSNGTLTRRASACTMPTAHQPPREDITTPGESPGGRLSRWWSIRRGSSHQYDVGGRDGRQSSSSSIDIPDAAACNEQHASPQKMSNYNSTNPYKMPGVPENEDDDTISLSASTLRFDVDLMIPPGSRANGTARTAHTRLITPTLPPAPPGLSQQQLKRRHIVAAIVHSENSYVATLQRLVNDYKQPLEESSPPVLSAAKISTLFHRLPEILHSHKLFRIALAECVRNWDRDEKLGDCFVSAFSKPRILEIYSGFINNFSAAMELAKMEEKRKSALADFFKVKQISAHDRLSFFGLMVKPVQRFPQFILFLQDLLKYTPQGHHDRMSLQLALTQLELLAEMLNERKREAEQYQGFKEMLGHISGTFNTRSLTSNDGNRPRYLLREDNVTHMEFNQAGFIVKSKQRRLLLLNDKVICVSVAPKQSHDFGATEKLSFKWMYPVTDVEIVDNSTSATLSRILTAGLNRGGSLKSNSSSCNNSTTNTLPINTSYTSSSLENSPAAQLTNGADNLCNEMSTLMYDYEIISRIHDLVGSLKGTYKELNSNITRNVLNTIQGSIQRKNEEISWVDSCCLQIIARSKSGKEETFTFQTQTPNVKKEWITELRLAQLALDPNNSPAWEASSTEPINTYEQQQQQQLQQKQTNKMPLFVKALPVYKSQHQTEVRCGCYYSIANDIKVTGNSRRRFKQQNYLWVCTSDGTSSHIAILSQHHQQAGNLRDVGAFDLYETQVSAMEFVKGLDNCKTREEYNSLLGDLIWMGTDSRKIFIYSAQNPEQEEQLGCCTVPGAVMKILYHFDAVYVALSNATMLIYRRSYDGVWMLKDPQLVQLGDTGLAVPSLLPINMNIYASCANRVYVLNALNGEIQKSFEVQHGASQQVNLMAHSGIGLWISLKNSTVLCLYHTETFKHLQDINIASSVLRKDGKKEQTVNNSSIYVTALMACKGLLWVGTNVGIAVTIPLPRLEGVPIISGGISMSCHAHFGPITFLLPLLPKVYSSYKPPPAQTLPTTVTTEASIPTPPPSMGDDLQLPAIDADPKKLTEEDLDESTVILRRDLPKDDTGSGAASPSASMLRDLSIDVDSVASSPRSSKLDKQNSLDQSFSAKIRASLANSPAFHRKRFRDLSAESSRMSKTLPRGLGASAGYYNANIHSNTSTLNHSEHGYCDVYGLYGKLIFVKEDYDTEEGTKGNLMDMMYEGMRRSDPELAAIPGKVSTLDRRLRMKASRPRSLDLSNWSVDSKSSSLYTSSGSEESMGIRLFGGRSVSRNSSSASHKTSGNGSDLGNISENGLMTTAEIHQHSTPKSEDGFKLMLNDCKQTMKIPGGTPTNTNAASANAVAPAVATLKRKQKQNAKQQQQQQNADGPRTVITLMGGRGYWRHVWYNNSNSPGHKAATLSSGTSSPLIANSNDAHIVVWEKKL
ncbi:rho guanine nucleotide exchange factor 10-like [Teleopsis dalmanni]|uniref:rho guanine nucleotide exchange factor 10-like n=1 Tax=Teleopsis dalmanni TaxID=139649 RepID=UPI0018CFD3C4|nr:rho guanine nucleotide exchange factor 10-like [Teleopsis dalmanni]